jgi:DNA-binding transcriptional regulator YiaG
MNMQDLRRHFGTQAAVARALGTSDQVVSAWASAGRIPIGRQYEIQILTAGKLRADPAHAVSQGEASTTGAA